VTAAVNPPPDSTLRLHFNENTAGCSPAVLAALRGMTREDVGRYPDIDAVTERTGRWLGAEAGGAMITNGLDEGLQIVAQCGVWHGHERAAARERDTARPEVIIVEPSFEVYEMCAATVGAAIVRIAPEPDFRFPLDRIAEAITPATRVIYLTDPNNPTGLGIPAGAVERIAAAAPHALVLVDEAYAEFSGRTLIGPLLHEHANLVIGRTFAKAFGLAALRVGAVVARPDTLARLRRLQLPFSVNACAIAGLSAALADRAYLDWYVAQSALSREMIYEFCRRHGLTFWPSEANFVLLRIGPGAGALVSALAARRIAVRDKSASPGCAGCIRLTAGVAEHTRVALSAMEETLAPRTH
jgi:histidinol-phosphate aminotransferase